MQKVICREKSSIHYCGWQRVCGTRRMFLWGSISLPECEKHAACHYLVSFYKSTSL